MNEEVEAYRYVTEGTFDAYLYQVVEGKQRFHRAGHDLEVAREVGVRRGRGGALLRRAEGARHGKPAHKGRMDLEVEVSRLRC